MSPKLVFVLMAAVAYFGLFLYRESFFLDYITFVIGTCIPFLAALAWLVITKKRRDEKKENIKNQSSNNNEVDIGEDGEIYHNDFSKVPGGVPDPNEPPPLPRSIGYGYGVGSQTVTEDLERMGIKDPDKKEE